MDLIPRSQDDFGETFSDGIRVGSIAIATYEYVALMTRQLLVM